LPGTTVLPAVLDDLEVRAWAGVLGAEKHGAIPRGTMTTGETTAYSRSKQWTTWHQESCSKTICDPSEKDLRQKPIEYCLKPVSAHPAGARARDASRGSISAWLWGLVGAVAVGLLWAFWSRSHRPAPAFPEMPLSVLTALASEPELTGPQANVIVRRLRP
jgi:hypothetical protein